MSGIPRPSDLVQFNIRENHAKDSICVRKVES